MADNFTICAGTVGTGAWVSPDGGESWRQVRTGLWAESRVFGFAIHPKQPRTILAGADDGIYRSENGGEHFERLDSPMNAIHVWKVAFDPTDPRPFSRGPGRRRSFDRPTPEAIGTNCRLIWRRSARMSASRA